MAVIYGHQGKLYYKVGGVDGGGSFVELTKATDVTITDEDSEEDVSCREDEGFLAVEPVQTSLQVEFEIIKDDTDTQFTDLRTAKADKSVVGIKMLDNDGGPGWQTDFKIFNFSDSQPLAGAQRVSVTLKRCRGHEFEALAGS